MSGDHVARREELAAYLTEAPEDDPCLECDGEGCDGCNYSGRHMAIRPGYRPVRPDELHHDGSAG